MIKEKITNPVFVFFLMISNGYGTTYMIMIIHVTTRQEIILYGKN